ncbi:winged helix-turn-helix transcriptional regulator [Thermoplasmatota archaeon]
MDDDCTVYQTMEYLSKKWSLIILLEIYKGLNEKKRYSEIKKNIATISPKILSTRLKELEKEGIIKKNIDTSSFPIKCEYSLTNSGIDLINIIKNIKDWSLKWKIKNQICEERNCKDCEL